MADFEYVTVAGALSLFGLQKKRQRLLMALCIRQAEFVGRVLILYVRIV